MYKVTCWNGEKIVSVLVGDLDDINIVLQYLGYLVDKDHFIKINFIDSEVD